MRMPLYASRVALLSLCTRPHCTLYCPSKSCLFPFVRLRFTLGMNTRRVKKRVIRLYSTAVLDGMLHIDLKNIKNMRSKVTARCASTRSFCT